MKTTTEISISELMDFLEKPENEDQIQYLANLEYIKNITEVEGRFGKLVKFGARMAKKQIDAALELAKCKTTADITAFRQTAHYKALEKGPIKISNNIKGLENLKDLENLKELENLKNLKS